MPFMQKQIIPYFPQEINPFFKNFPGTSPGSFFFRRGCQVEIFHKSPEHEKLHERGYSVAFRLPLLCKQIVNGGNFSTWVESCGQLLWRSMWRMWKTPCFPQLLAPIPCGWIGGKLRIPLCITCLRMVSGVDYVTVCIQKFPKKKAPSVGICRTLTGSEPGRMSPHPTNFVKNRQRPPFFPLFCPGYQFPALGNTVGETDQEEDFSCREKWRSAG